MARSTRCDQVAGSLLLPSLLVVFLSACAAGIGSGGAGAATGQPSRVVDMTDGIAAAGVTIDAARFEAIGARGRAHLDWALIDAHDVRDLAVVGDELAVATAGGLVIVRGGVVTHRVTALDGLPHGGVRSLSTAPDGRLWMAIDNGACRVWRTELRGRPGELASCGQRLSDTLVVDLEWTDRGLLVLARDGAVLRLESSSSATTELAPASSERARAHRVAGCGDVVWVASRRGGLWRVAGGDAHRERDVPPVVEAITCAPGAVDALIVASVDGVRTQTDEAWAHVTLPTGSSRVSWVGLHGGAVRLGLPDGSLWSAEPEPSLVAEVGIPISAGAEVGESAYFGGPEGLVRVVDQTGRRTGRQTASRVALPGPGSTDVAAVAADGERLALGLFRSGVAIWRGDGWQRVDERRGLPADEVNSLAFDPRGGLWAATNHGLAYIGESGLVERVVAEPEAPCHHMNAVLVGERGGDVVVSVASSCGVGQSVGSTGAPFVWDGRDEGLPHRISYTLAWWGDVLVAGTNDGLALRDNADAERPWRSFRAGNSALNDNWITAVAALDDGRLAVGTYSGGLYVGASPEALQRLDGPRYINLNALSSFGDRLLAGGLSEGGYDVRGDRVAALDASRCLAGDDVTGFALWRDQLIVATRSGAAALPAGCY